MNMFCLVGKIEKMPILKETTNGTKTCNLLLNVKRPFANKDGIYETDLIGVDLWRGLAESVCKKCSVGDYIAIKGRIVSKIYSKDDRKYYNYSFTAESLDFINK